MIQPNKKTSMSFICSLLKLSCLSLWVVSLAAYSLNRCWEKSLPADRVSTACEGAIIPSEHTRNFKREYLTCKQATSRYTLRYQPTGPDYPAEVSLLTNFHTVLNWEWEDCGWTNSKIRCRGSKNCYVDYARSNSISCSTEVLEVHIRFNSGDKQNSNPDTFSDSGLLQNNHELLPGEEEALLITVSPGTLFTTTDLTPELYFENQKYDYDIKRLVGDGYSSGSLPCKQGAGYTIGFVLTPKGRIQSRSANFFTLPEDSEDNESYNMQASQYPASVQVQGCSPEFLKTAFNETIVRIQLYEDSPFSFPFNLLFSFFPQSTIYRTVDQESPSDISSDPSNACGSSLWTFELDDKESEENLYSSRIPWFPFYPLAFLFSESNLIYDRHLEPNKPYVLKLSVYQKGASSLYYQACEDEPEAMDCAWYAGWGIFSPSRYENNYFSKDLEIKFTANNGPDLRTWIETTWDTATLVVPTVLSAAVLAYTIATLIKKYHR